MTFTEWLLLEKQQNRKGSIGAIAREAARDNAWPSQATTLAEYKQYLRQLGAETYVIEALTSAWLAYKREAV